MTPFVTRSEYKKMLIAFKRLIRHNASLTESLKESVRQHRHYMKRKGKSKRYQDNALMRAYNYRNKLDELKRLLGVLSLPRQASTKGGRRYLVRLNLNELGKFRKFLKTDFRGVTKL